MIQYGSVEVTTFQDKGRREKKVERDYVMGFCRNSIAICCNCWRLILP